MNKCKHLLAVLSMSLASILITGCFAEIANHKLPKAGLPQPIADVSQAVKAKYQFTSGEDYGKGRKEDSTFERQSLEMEFVDQFKESGCFAALRSGKEDGLQIDVDMLRYGRVPYVFCSISVVTLTVIPCWATEYRRINVKVISAEGKRIEYALDDAITTVVWLPMIVARPFINPKKVEADIRKNMYRNIILKMQQDGLLPPLNKAHQIQ